MVLRKTQSLNRTSEAFSLYFSNNRCYNLMRTVVVKAVNVDSNFPLIISIKPPTLVQFPNLSG